MRHPPGLFSLFLLFVLLAACQASRERAPSHSVKPGLAFAADEVAADPVAVGLVGGFYKDGSDGDIRARTENFFANDLGDAEKSGGTKKQANGEPALDDVTNNPAQDAKAKDRMLVHRGDVHVEVARPDEVMAEFQAQVVAWGGHLQSQQDRTLVVRVPVTRFEEAFTWVHDAGRLLSESRQAEDVTEEFVDLGIRLDNARKSRERLLEVLKRADKVEDILKVEAELRRLTEEIERMEGRKKLLADQVAMSTLSATFQAVTEAPARKRSRQPSRFDWINRIGAERVMEEF